VDRSGTLLYDADCGLCIATATWLGRVVPASRLGLLPLQEVDAHPDMAKLVDGRALGDRVHFVRVDGVVMTGARAVLAAGRLVPGLGLYAALVDRPPGHRLLEPLYDQVASHRRLIGRLLGLSTECALPSRQVVGTRDAFAEGVADFTDRTPTL
jgi:predicted DCC family thiol-disulfide oxidoreductase YuxK